MEALRKAEQELYEQIESLSKAIKSQKNTLDNWDENNPMMLSKETFRKSMIKDIHRVEMLRASYCKVLDEMKREIYKV